MHVPPVFRTTGIEPNLIAVSWVSPHGSKIEGTRMKSAPAYIYQWSKGISNFQGHTANLSGKHATRKKIIIIEHLSSVRRYQVRERLIVSQTKASTVTMSRMQLIGQIHKIILNTRIWGWTKQYNLHVDVHQHRQWMFYTKKCWYFIFFLTSTNSNYTT